MEVNPQLITTIPDGMHLYVNFCGYQDNATQNDAQIWKPDYAKPPYPYIHRDGGYDFSIQNKENNTEIWIYVNDPITFAIISLTPQAPNISFTGEIPETDHEKNEFLHLNPLYVDPALDPPFLVGYRSCWDKNITVKQAP